MAGLNTYVQLFATVLEGSSISILNVALSITVPLHFYITVPLHLCTSAFYTLKPSSAVPIFTIGTSFCRKSFPQHVAIARGNWELVIVFFCLSIWHMWIMQRCTCPHYTFAFTPMCRLCVPLRLCASADILVRLCASVPLRLGDATLHLRAFPLRHVWANAPLNW